VKVRLSDRFERDLVALNNLRRGRLDVEALRMAIAALIDDRPMPSALQDHPLAREWKGFREFHIGDDDLVICRLVGDVAVFRRAGTHQQLFKKPLKKSGR
jgi:mRNA interferase YafQ